jgi:hypothetical protein
MFANCPHALVDHALRNMPYKGDSRTVYIQQNLYQP